MPSLFNSIRLGLYSTVIVFGIICLALAANFLTVLASSDLTRFVPLAIFVSCAGTLIVATLLGFSCLKGHRNPISTRIELASLGLAALLWLILGVFLATSESQDADVECFSSLTATVPLDDMEASFHTEQFQAMYHVLMAFSLVNACLLIFAFVALMYLALKRYYSGDQQMWYGPVTSCPWLAQYTKNESNKGVLPGPGGAKRSNTYTEKPARTHGTRRTNTTRSVPLPDAQPTGVQRQTSSSAPQPPPKLPTPVADAHGFRGRDQQTSTRRPTKPYDPKDPYGRNASPRRR